MKDEAKASYLRPSELAPAPSPPTAVRRDDIGRVTSRFIEEIDSLAATLPLAMRSIADARKSGNERIKRFIEEYGSGQDKVKGTFTIPAEHVLRFQTLERRLTRVRTASVLVPRSFLVNLVSQYDAFLGRLIRALLLTKPEVLSASEKTVSFSELVGFGSIEAARDHIIEKEVESVLRKSHTEQFDWLENKFKITLRQDLSVWPKFVEITERRNLYVHTGGLVSSQYLQNCQTHNVDCNSIKAGSVLAIAPAYFYQAYQVIFEIGVKLAHVFWRKLKPAELQDADKHLSGVACHLLVERKYDLAKAMLDFATEVLKKHSSTELRLHFVVNRVLAYKWSGDELRARAILGKEDFSALSDTFKLADAVLRDDFAAAQDLVKRIGRAISIGAYRDWPLFRELRKQANFERIILDVFGEPLNVTLRAPESRLSPETESTTPPLEVTHFVEQPNDPRTTDLGSGDRHE